MAAEGGCGGEEMTSSPKSRLKILCSHGGKILPRPADGHLKYVGGETRVVALPRNITYAELMKKLTIIFDGDMILKYQLIPEDLDTLVSVRTDDDLRHMTDEYDRQENGGSPKLRAFLFPSSPIIVENQMASMNPRAHEQRYIDAINGIIRATCNANRSSSSISSCSSSPKTVSPDKYTAENTVDGYKNHHSNHHIHHYHHNHHIHSHHSSKPPLDPYKSNAGDNFASPLSSSRVDNLRGQMGYGSNYYYSTTRNHRGSGCGGINKFGHFNEFGAYGYRRLDRADAFLVVSGELSGSKC